jgi:toxin ParE1/3/4
VPALAFSRTALADIREIGAYIAQDNPVRAASFVLQLEAQCRAVAAAPSIYPARFDLAPRLRMAAYGRYLVFFRDLPGDNKVRVERVLHSARDLPALFRT